MIESRKAGSTQIYVQRIYWLNMFPGRQIDRSHANLLMHELWVERATPAPASDAAYEDRGIMMIDDHSDFIYLFIFNDAHPEYIYIYIYIYMQLERTYTYFPLQLKKERQNIYASCL